MSSPQRPNSLPKTLVLRSPATFRDHYDKGHRESAGPLLALALPSTRKETRLGLSTPKKLGSAVLRNRLRRRLREAFRTTKAHHPAHTDLVILIRPHEEKTTEEYRSLLLKLFQKLSTPRKPKDSH